METKFIKCRDVKTPTYGTEGSNGLDFYIPNDWKFMYFTLHPGCSIQIPSGIKIELPKEFALVAMAKSSMGSKGLLVNAPLIDSDYRGELYLPLVNVSNNAIVLKAGDKIVQFCCIHIPQITLIEADENSFSKTSRGEGGFGSTGAS